MRWKSPSLEMGLEADRRSKVKQNAQQQQSSKQVESSSATASPASEPSASLGTKVVGGDVGSSVDAVDSKQDIDEKDIQSFGPGWRVEFRPLEIQLTDFENAAFSLLTVLTTRSLLAMGYNFYLPVSLMESNMERAQQENAVMTQKFWVRKEAFSPSLTTIPLTSANTKSAPVTVPGVNKFGTIKRKKAAGETEESACLVPKMSEITAIELTLDEFFNGRAGTVQYRTLQYSTAQHIPLSRDATSKLFRYRQRSLFEIVLFSHTVTLNAFYHFFLLI